MARPRKDQGSSAEQRIKQAFWSLLETTDLRDLTVGMIAKQAQCNRGTFYYHYQSLDELFDVVITEELLLENGVPRGLFYLVCKHINPFEDEEFMLHVNRFSLMMERAGQQCVDAKAKASIVKSWEQILYTHRPLTMETRLIIEYTTSGIIGLLSYLHREGLLNTSPIPDELLANLTTNCQYLVSSISQAQNIPLRELEDRICAQLRTSMHPVCETCERVQAPH